VVLTWFLPQITSYVRRLNYDVNKDGCVEFVGKGNQRREFVTVCWKISANRF